jgi:hypothetical protein
MKTGKRELVKVPRLVIVLDSLSMRWWGGHGWMLKNDYSRSAIFSENRVHR